MKIPTMLPAVALMALLTFSCSTDAIEEDAIDDIAASFVPDTKIIEIEVLELINDHRINLGLNPLETMSEIKAQAYGHTDYMIDQSAVSHDNFYVRRNNLMSTAGAQSVGENVAYGFSYAPALVAAWLNSEGHKAVIEGDYTDFDLSAEQDADGRWYYTNIFIKR